LLALAVGAGLVAFGAAALEAVRLAGVLDRDVAAFGAAGFLALAVGLVAFLAAGFAGVFLDPGFVGIFVSAMLIPPGISG
jgi:hypothetical protein